MYVTTPSKSRCVHGPVPVLPPPGPGAAFLAVSVPVVGKGRFPQPALPSRVNRVLGPFSSGWVLGLLSGGWGGRHHLQEPLSRVRPL